MQVRYRCRIYPSPGQRQMLARTFGCARVVYNDCLRLRNAYHAAGKKISDTEVQRQVVTLAKQNPERAWLGEVASVALVQACQDARRAYRNWFDSLSGRRKGRKVGRPSFRRKHRRQSIRLTRNGFALRGERLYVASLVVTSDGEIIGNPRFLRAKERKLARAQRALSRKRSDTMHDRDVNAAKNVLALGRRESLNARGGNVRPGLVPADPVETGTHRSAA